MDAAYYPSMYKMIKEKIYQSDNPEIRKAGLRVIAIPGSVREIPEWLHDLIDYDIY